MPEPTIDWSPISEALSGAQRILVTTHKHPDGDAVGSSVAMGRHLRESGKEIRIIIPTDADPRFAFLAPDIDLEPYDDSLHRDWIASADTAVVLDTGNWSLLGPLSRLLDELTLRVIAIDHHPGVPERADLSMVIPTASSTAELIDHYLEHEERPIDAISASALFTGLATDTGWFRYHRTTPELMRRAANLLDRGVNGYRLYTRIFESRNWSVLTSLSRAMSDIEPRLDGRAAFILLDRDILAGLSTDPMATEALLDLGLSIDSVRVSALLKESGPEIVKISLRSKGDVDVGSLAAQHGGGGHRSAAGMLFRMSLESAAQRLEAVLHPAFEAGS